MQRRQLVGLILVIVFIGIVLRFWGLGTHSFWNDELSSWYRSHYNSLADVLQHAQHDVHPPGHHVVIYWVEQFIGDSEFALRLPSATFGVFSIVLMMFLGFRLYSYKEGLIAGLFISAFWFPIYYSQEARAYSALLMFSILSTWLWYSIFETLREDKGLKTWSVIGYIVSAECCAYFHYYGVLLVGLQSLSLLFAVPKSPRNIGKVLLLYIPIGLLYLPWIIPTLKNISKGGPGWITAPKFGDALLVLFYFFNKSEVLKHLALLVYISPLVFWTIKKAKQGQFRIGKTYWFSPGPLLFLWLVVPYLIAFVFSHLGKPVLLPRCLIITLPAAYLLLARAVVILPRKSLQFGSITILVLFSLIDLFAIKQYYWKPQKEQFREAVAYVEKKAMTTPHALIVGCVWNKEYLNYYFDKLDSDIRVDLVAGKREDIQELEELIEKRQSKNIWYIRANRKLNNDVMQYIKKKFTIVGHAAFLGTDVWLFRAELL